MSEAKIRIKNLYKIFGRDPKAAMEHVNNGAGKDELLEKYNHVLGLKDINLDIESQSIQVVMGLSGSGKSTLIRHINRLIEPTEGVVLVDDQDVTQFDKNELLDFRRTRTGMVFQRFGLFPHQNIIENVKLGLSIKGVDKSDSDKTAMYWIDKVGLNGFEFKFPNPGTGLPQYTSSMFCFLFVVLTSLIYATNLGHFLQLIIVLFRCLNLISIYENF